MKRRRQMGGRLTESAAAPRLTAERIWNELEKASFAVISYVTPAGRPRASGVMYAAVDRHLYMVTAPDSWKARQISDGDEVSLTAPIRRGGVLSLVATISPATVSFHARATVHPAGSVNIESVSKKLASLLPQERATGCLLELVPEGNFLTYGVGVSLRDMRKPAAGWRTCRSRWEPAASRRREQEGPMTSKFVRISAPRRDPR
jgi:hypothetical protein